MTENTNDIPQINQLLYTLKLSTGEELLCTLVDTTDVGIIIESPIIVRPIPIMTDDGLKHELSSSLFMPFASTRSFFIPLREVIAFNEMHPSSHLLYVRLVNKLESTLHDTSVSPSPNSTVVEASSVLQ